MAGVEVIAGGKLTAFDFSGGDPVVLIEGHVHGEHAVACAPNQFFPQRVAGDAVVEFLNEFPPGIDPDADDLPAVVAPGIKHEWFGALGQPTARRPQPAQ